MLQIFTRSHKLNDINDDYWDVRAEPVPEEEMNPSATSRTIHVYHIAPGPGPGVSLSLAYCLYDLHSWSQCMKKQRLNFRCGPLLHVWLRFPAMLCKLYKGRP